MANFHKKQEVKAFRKEESNLRIAKRLDCVVAFSGKDKDSLIGKLNYYRYINYSGIIVGCNCGCGGHDVDHPLLKEGQIIYKALYE